MEKYQLYLVAICCDYYKSSPLCKRQSKNRNKNFTPNSCLFDIESQALSSQTFCVRHAKNKKKENFFTIFKITACFQQSQVTS